MIAKITENGMLLIERGGEMKEQWCPYSTSTDTQLTRCGDWCPLFGEPQPHKKLKPRSLCLDQLREWEETGKTAIQLCIPYLVLDVLTDERGK